FISGLRESGVDFIAADNPHANKLMVHMLAAFAEHEREQISQRTKEALVAAKARGIRLGRNGADRLAPAYRAQAIERARKLAPLLAELKSAGLSVRQMAVELTARGIPTPTRARWHAQTFGCLIALDADDAQPTDTNGGRQALPNDCLSSPCLRTRIERRLAHKPTNESPHRPALGDCLGGVEAVAIIPVALPLRGS